MKILRVLWRVLWRLVVGLILIMVLLATWNSLQETREELGPKISKYEALATQSVIRKVDFDSEYQYWDPTAKGTLYELSFQYRDPQGRMRKGKVTTYSLPADFNQQPMHFLRNDFTIHAFDVDHTVAEKVDEYSHKITVEWVFFGFVAVFILFCLFGLVMSWFPDPRTPADFMALDTEQLLKIRRKVARDGGELVVSTTRGKVRLKIPPGSRSGTTMRIAGYGRQSKFDERVYGDAYVKLQVRRWPW